MEVRIVSLFDNVNGKCETTVCGEEFKPNKINKYFGANTLKIMCRDLTEYFILFTIKKINIMLYKLILVVGK